MSSRRFLLCAHGVLGETVTAVDAISYSARWQRADPIERQADEELTRFADSVDHEAQWERLDPLWKPLPSRIAHVADRQPRHPAGLQHVRAAVRQVSRGAGDAGHGVTGPGAGPFVPAGTAHSFYQRVKLSLQRQGKTNPLIQMAWALRLLKRRAFMKLIGQESIMGWVYYRHLTGRRQALLERINLRILYTHHRLVVMRVDPLPGSSR